MFTTEALYREAVAYIEIHYGEAITASDIYKYMHVDRTYMWRIFQKHAGMSPQQFLMRFRIDKAAELISQSSSNLTETARSVGIPDLYYFSRLFKKIKGTSPSKYSARCEVGHYS